MHLRALTGRDAAAFQVARLRALLDNPEAFGSTHGEEEDTALSVIATRLDKGEADGTSFVLGAALAPDAPLVGLAACFRQTSIKQRHLATVGGMYVAPEARGRGIGAGLLDAVIARARQWDGLEQLVLTVATENAAARALYRSRGFVSFGIAPRALKQDAHYHDVEHMWLSLSAG